MGLDNPQFTNTRCNVLRVDPLLNSNIVYYMVVQEERVGLMTQGKEERGEWRSNYICCQVSDDIGMGKETLHMVAETMIALQI